MSFWARAACSEKAILSDMRTVERQVDEVATRYGLKVDPSARVSTLSVGEQQRVEIVKALYRGVNLLILDEPTAVLTPQETTDLFRTLRTLTAAGLSIIFITHKLNEVMAAADRVTVLRDGKVVGQRLIGETTPHDLAQLMVGRDVQMTFEKPAAAPGQEMLVIEPDRAGRRRAEAARQPVAARRARRDRRHRRRGWQRPA